MIEEEIRALGAGADGGGGGRDKRTAGGAPGGLLFAAAPLQHALGLCHSRCVAICFVLQ